MKEVITRRWSTAACAFLIIIDIRLGDQFETERWVVNQINKCMYVSILACALGCTSGSHPLSIFSLVISYHCKSITNTATHFQLISFLGLQYNTRPLILIQNKTKSTWEIDKSIKILGVKWGPRYSGHNKPGGIWGEKISGLILSLYREGRRMHWEQ